MAIIDVKPQRLSALVLEDQALMRDIIRSHLTAMGFHEVEVAATTAEAEKMMHLKKYDVIFVDWILPGQSGYSLMKKYREDRAYDDVAFVMVTSQAEAHYMIEAMKAGATSYIIKPIIGADFKDIVTTVLEWLGKARAQVASRKP